MSVKRFHASGMIILLLALTLIASGCATTSSQAAKPHKPQMITSDGVEEVGGFHLPSQFDKGFALSDTWADIVSFFGFFLQFLTGSPSG